MFPTTTTTDMVSLNVFFSNYLENLLVDSSNYQYDLFEMYISPRL